MMCKAETETGRTLSRAAGPCTLIHTTRGTQMPINGNKMMTAQQQDDEYQLDPAIAATLRRPAIDYPGGMVPSEVIASICVDVPLRNGAPMPLADVLALITRSNR